MTGWPDGLPPPLSERLAEVAGSEHLARELALLADRRVLEYYKRVAALDMDRANPKNSYVMWVAGRVDALDPSAPPVVTPRRNALPDIDCDFSVWARDAVLAYLRRTYGEDRVCQMSTFGRMQGRAALKDVLRAHDRCSFEEMNAITAAIPDEAAISDDLQEMLEAGEDPSIIRWALEHNAEALAPYCRLAPDGSLDGPLAADFAQAIRLEGTRRSHGKHASGVVVCSEPVADVVPMARDPGGGPMIAGWDMHACEAAGLVKFDVLGVAALDKLGDCVSLLATGHMAQRGGR